MTVVDFEDVTKSFTKNAGRLLLRERIARLLAGKTAERFYALKNVSFRIEEGEGVAIVGRNGAGKSTLLSLVAGLATPDTGRVLVNGRIAPLLELGSGFHPDLTGAENIGVNASLVGLGRRQASELFDSIVEFSGMSAFINEPLRTYSSGMIMRLAFSVAVNMAPDILLVDEILAVGDQAFQEKCFERIRQFRRAGKTLLCVSHFAGLVAEFCDQAIWLEHGETVLKGSLRDVFAAYQESKATAVV